MGRNNNYTVESSKSATNEPKAYFISSALMHSDELVIILGALVNVVRNVF